MKSGKSVSKGAVAMASQPTLLGRVPQALNMMKRCDRVVLFVNIDALITLPNYDDDRAKEIISLMSEMLEDERYTLVLVSGSDLNQMKRALPVPHAIYTARYGMEINIGTVKLMNPKYLEYQRAIEGIHDDMGTFMGATLTIEDNGNLSLSYANVPGEEVMEVKKAFIKAVRDRNGLDFELLQGQKSITAVIARRTQSSMLEIVMAEIGAINPFVIFLGALKTDKDVISAISRSGPNLCAVTDAPTGDKKLPYASLRSVDEFMTFIHMLLEENKD